VVQVGEVMEADLIATKERVKNLLALRELPENLRTRKWDVEEKTHIQLR
jgi:hypothetical protein